MSNNTGQATCRFCGSDYRLFTIFNKDMQALCKIWKRRHEKGCKTKTPAQRRKWAKKYADRNPAESSLTVDLTHPGFADVEQGAIQALDSMHAALDTDKSRQSVILEQVRQLVTTKMFDAITAYLDEDDFLVVDDFKIATEPCGELEEQDYLFSPFYVRQESVGIEGDSFTGTISIPLPDSRYFQFSYSV